MFWSVIVNTAASIARLDRQGQKRW